MTMMSETALVDAQRAYEMSRARMMVSRDARDTAIVEAHESGLGYGAIAKVLDLPTATVQSVVRKHRRHPHTRPVDAGSWVPAP